MATLSSYSIITPCIKVVPTGVICLFATRSKKYGGHFPKRLQLTQDAAARHIRRTKKRAHITLVLRKLRVTHLTY